MRPGGVLHATAAETFDGARRLNSKPRPSQLCDSQVAPSVTIVSHPTHSPRGSIAPPRAPPPRRPNTRTHGHAAPLSRWRRVGHQPGVGCAQSERCAGWGLVPGSLPTGVGDVSFTAAPQRWAWLLRSSRTGATGRYRCQSRSGWRRWPSWMRVSLFVGEALSCPGSEPAGSPTTAPAPSRPSQPRAGEEERAAGRLAEQEVAGVGTYRAGPKSGSVPGQAPAAPNSQCRATS